MGERARPPIARPRRRGSWRWGVPSRGVLCASGESTAAASSPGAVPTAELSYPTTATSRLTPRMTRAITSLSQQLAACITHSRAPTTSARPVSSSRSIPTTSGQRGSAPSSRDSSSSPSSPRITTRPSHTARVPRPPAPHGSHTSNSAGVLLIWRSNRRVLTSLVIASSVVMTGEVADTVCPSVRSSATGRASTRRTHPTSAAETAWLGRNAPGSARNVTPPSVDLCHWKRHRAQPSIAPLARATTPWNIFPVGLPLPMLTISFLIVGRGGLGGGAPSPASPTSLSADSGGFEEGFGEGPVEGPAASPPSGSSSGSRDARSPPGSDDGRRARAASATSLGGRKSTRPRAKVWISGENSGSANPTREGEGDRARGAALASTASASATAAIEAASCRASTCGGSAPAGASAGAAPPPSPAAARLELTRLLMSSFVWA
mmetsp:Transcript_47407/g.151839  ORF Transcript_47407/g.151839 Transcript_47407/m.151839 type:complete len:435 (+) Transcript_47407:268-1572(+)